MKRDHIDRVFGHGRLQMVTGSHVEVFREATLPGERRRYTKRFLLTEGGDFRHWTEREWRILARLVGHGITSVPEVAQFDRGGPDRPALVQTYDAGITVDHWATLLPVQRDGRVLRHVFQDCAHWWALARHCLVALDAIHELDLLHLDLKADNVCIPPAPPDFSPTAAGQTLQPAFEQLALIDFAFSLVSGDELATALPIGQQPDDDYQSPRLLHALEAGRFGDLLPMRQLDWRCDLYSLASMLARYLPRPGSAAAPGWKDWRHAQARVLLRRLADAHDQAAPTQRPHQELIAMTRLALSDPELVDSLRRGWLLAPEGAIDDAELATPVTRLAMPLVAPISPLRHIEPALAAPPLSPMRADPRPLPAVARPRSRSPLVWTAAAAVGAAAVVASVPLLAEVWLSLRDGEPITLARWNTPPVETPPPVAAAPVDDVPAGPAAASSAIAASAATTPAPAAPGSGTAAIESSPAPAPVVAATAASKKAAPSAAPLPAATPPPKRAARGAASTSVRTGPVASARPAAGASRVPTAVKPRPAPRPVAVASTPAAPKAKPQAVPKAAPTPPPLTMESDAKAAEAARAYVMAALAREKPSRSTSARAPMPAVPPAPAAPSAPLASSTSVAAPAADASGASAPPSPPSPPPQMAAPAPESARSVPPPPRAAAAAALPQDFAARAGVLMVDYLPQIAQRAERVIGALLQTASRRDAAPQDDTVLQAARASKLAPDRALASIDVSASDAQQLNDAARAAFARGGSLGRAMNLQTRAFGANPQDVEVVGNLAYFHLVENADWPETARRLALHALTIPDARYPTGRLRDWTTFAFASALSGHERDARDALLVSLAVTGDVDRLCRSVVDAYETHGERLRGPVQAMMKRIRLWGLAPQSTSCRVPWNAGGAFNAR